MISRSDQQWPDEAFALTVIEGMKLRTMERAPDEELVTWAIRVTDDARLDELRRKLVFARLMEAVYARG